MIAIIFIAIILAMFALSAIGKMEQYNDENKTLWQEVDGVKIMGPNAQGDGFMIRLA